MPVKDFLKEIETVFKKAGIDCAEREAMLLACHVLSVDQVWLFLHKDDYIEEKVLLASAALINERCKGRPLAYIIGSANFCGVDITVDERVLIPRPETELLVEEAVKYAECLGKSDGSGLRILDLCTGSGCIAAALADNLPKAEIIASDLSLKALQLAGYNTRPFGNVKTLKSDLFDKIEGNFDIIVSNPPYVENEARSWMQKEVKDYEPEMALFAGDDGLDLIRPILEQVGSYLKSGALFLMEFGDKQSEEILRLAEKTGDFSEFEIKKDLGGLDRYLKAKKSNV